LFRRDQRDRWRARAPHVRLHLVDAPVEVRRARVRARNAGGADLTVEVDDPTFAWSETYWQPPDPDEQAEPARSF
jgi:predicted kinase